jgi:uncharacterized protein YerC
VKSPFGDLFPEKKAARKALIEWAAMDRQRDDRIRAAREALLTYDEIQEITGLARTTIARIAPGYRYRRGSYSATS